MADRKKSTRKRRRPKARPEPQTQREFAELQKEWYNYLSETGFEDLEWVDHSTGYGQNSDTLKNPSSYIAKQYDPAVAEYYRKCRIFLEHGDFESGLHKYVFKRHTEGASYRQIAKEVKKRVDLFNGKTVSIFWISQHLNDMLDWVELWHMVHPEGVNVPDPDFYIEDIPLRSAKDHEE